MAVTVDNTKGAYTIPALSGSGYVPIGGGTMTGALTIASGTLTASAPALNITQTWDAVGTRFDSAVVNVTNTASAAGSTLQSWRLAGVQKASVNKSGGLEAYNLYTDASNYERGVFDWSLQSNVLVIGMQKGGTGSAREVLMISPYYISFGSAPAVPQWLFDTGNTGSLRPLTNNLYDLGSTSLRVRYGYFATGVVISAVAFASLPAAATVGNGARAHITNCSHATFGTAADGGGSTKVPVYSDGTSWLVG